MRILTSLNGSAVPYVGLGTFGIKPKAVYDAVKIGYRIIDTSDDYANEDMIGQQLQGLYKEGVVKREDLFIQTKISDNASFPTDPLIGVYFWKSSPFMSRHTVEDIIKEKIEDSKIKLKTDYLDSVLLHFPYPDFYKEMWDVLCKLKDRESIRYIGVSNFSVIHFEELKEEGFFTPEINQTYFSPIGTRQEVCDYCNNNGISLMTYSPLMDCHSSRLDFPVFKTLEKKYKKTRTQIVLRWNIDRGSIPCPKSNHLERLKDNFELFDFELSKEDIELISSLNVGYQYLPESRFCPGI